MSASSASIVCALFLLTTTVLLCCTSGAPAPAKPTAAAKVAATASAGNDTAECYSNELFYRGQCYHFKNDVGMPFESARAYCLKRKSHMVIINSDDVNQWIVTQDRTRFGRWIGMMRVDEGNGMRFHWVPDDSSPAYTNFNDMKMDYSEQKCVYMDTDGQWADNTCSQPYNVICQRNPLAATITGLQAAFNASFERMQSRLAKLESLITKQQQQQSTNGTASAAVVSNNNNATVLDKLAKSVDNLTQQLTIRQNNDSSSNNNVSARQLSNGLNDLSLLLNSTRQAARNSADIRQRLDTLRTRINALTSRVDNFTTLAANNNASEVRFDQLHQFLSLIDHSVLSLEKRLNESALFVAPPNANATTDDAVSSSRVLSTSQAALYGPKSSSENNSRIGRTSVVLMLLVLVLQVGLICLVILLGVYVRSRYRSDRSFQYNVTSASSRFANNNNNNQHHLMGRDSLALTSTRSSATPSSSSDELQRRVVYEEIDGVGGRSDTLVRGSSGSPVMPTSSSKMMRRVAENDGSDGSSSVDSARTDSIYMSTVDAAVAELELQSGGKRNQLVRDSDVESSAGCSTLSARNSMYDAHSDRQPIINKIALDGGAMTAGGNNGGGVIRY